MDPGTAVIISAGLGTIGWYVTVRNNRMVDRRQHTYRVIIRQLDDVKFETALHRVRQVLSKNDIPSPDNELRIDDIQKLDYLLNHYEFLSAAIWCGDMDETLIKSCEFSRITKLHAKMKTYIDACRELRQQPTMFENLEQITIRWTGPAQSRRHRIYEMLLWRPCKQIPNWLAKLD